MKPSDVICPHCARNTYNARFRSPKICLTCYRRAKKGKPHTPLPNSPHNANTCTCGGFKPFESKRCRDCYFEEVTRAPLACDAQTAQDRSSVRHWLIAHGFTGESVPA